MLRQLVKTAFQPRLDHCAASELVVYPADAPDDEAKELGSGEAVPQGTTAETPLIVVAPTPEPGMSDAE
jgi:hypothetical protein